MTNIYFWGKTISPTFYKQSHLKPSTILSLYTDSVIKNVTTGIQTTFMLTDDNQVYAFGSNQQGQLGLGFNPYKNIQLTKIYLPTKTKIVSISCGWNHTLILDQLGCLFSSGKGLQGAIGQGNRQNSYSFKQIMTGIRKMSAGYDHSLAIKGNKVYGWGNSQDGQLGLYSKKRFLSPKQLNVYPCQQVFAGAKYSIFITVKGLYGCGRNNSYQLGLGHNKDLHYPKKLNIQDDIVQIWGGNYCLAKNKKQQIWIWGTGAFGIFKYPTKIPFFENYQKISLGLNFGIVNKNNKIYVWGSNNFGQLGTDSQQIKDYAYQCEKLSQLNLDEFSCGGNFVIGLKYGQENKIQEKIKGQFTNDQIIEQFYGSEDLNNQNKQKVFKRSLYSSCEFRPKKNTKINGMNEKMKGKDRNNMDTYSLKRQKNKNNSHDYNSSNSQKQNSYSNNTVKKMMPLKIINNNNKECMDYNKSEKPIHLMNKLVQQLSQLKIQIQQRRKCQNVLNQQNACLRQFIKSQILKQSCQLDKFNPNINNSKLKQQNHSINHLIQNNLYLKDLLGLHNQKQFQNTHNNSNIQQIQQFGTKLTKLKNLLQEAVLISQSQRSSNQ